MPNNNTNQNPNRNQNQMLIPTFDFGQTLGEVFGEALVKFARWALDEKEMEYREWSDDSDNASSCEKDGRESVGRESGCGSEDDEGDGEKESLGGGLRAECEVNVGCVEEKKDIEDDVVNDDDVNTTAQELKNIDIHKSQSQPDTKPQGSLDPPTRPHNSSYSVFDDSEDGVIIYTPDESNLDIDDDEFEDLGDPELIWDRSRSSSSLSLVEVGVDVVEVGLGQSLRQLQQNLQQSRSDKEGEEERGEKSGEIPIGIVTPTRLKDNSPYRALDLAVADLEEEGGLRAVPAAKMSVFAQEGVEVARRIWEHFWSEEHSHFRTDGKTAETIGDWNGFTCWAYLIGLEAILEAEKSSPGTLQDEIQKALYGMEKFWSPDRGAYCAWIWFKGNGDIYIDDNAQVAILLLLAHRLLPPPPTGFPYRSYAERAEQVVKFCLTGWDEVNGGGVRWHVSTEGPPWTNRNACSTSLTAVAALELASILREGGVPNEHPRVRDLVDWGRRCVDWVWAELVVGNESGLVLDGIIQTHKGGEWLKVGPTYTYNTGHTITALVLLYDLLLPGDPCAPTVHLRATSLVISSIDQNKTLYDTTVPNLQHRYWWDNNFFVHLLVEGLVSWGLRFGSEEPQLWHQARAEIHREMTYLMLNLRDRDDGLYWRNFRLYTISMGHLRLYKSITGDEDREAKLDSSERKQDDKSMQVPVGNRGMVKTLLGCGGAGRSLCIAGRVV